MMSLNEIVKECLEDDYRLMELVEQATRKCVEEYVERQLLNHNYLEIIEDTVREFCDDNLDIDDAIDTEIRLMVEEELCSL